MDPQSVALGHRLRVLLLHLVVPAARPVLLLSEALSFRGEALPQGRALFFSVHFYPTPQHVVLTKMRQAGKVRGIPAR